jgi:hypothetical protein
VFLLLALRLFLLGQRRPLRQHERFRSVNCLSACRASQSCREGKCTQERHVRAKRHCCFPESSWRQLGGRYGIVPAERYPLRSPATLGRNGGREHRSSASRIYDRRCCIAVRSLSATDYSLFSASICRLHRAG